MSLFRLETWRPVHLLIAWCGFWCGLAFVAIAPGLPALFHVSKDGVKGDASISFGDGVIKIVISEAGVPTWAHEYSALLWCLAGAVPALILWAAWLRATAKARA